MLTFSLVASFYAISRTKFLSNTNNRRVSISQLNISKTHSTRYREIPFPLSLEPGKRVQPSVACDDVFVSRRIFAIDSGSRISFLVDTGAHLSHVSARQITRTREQERVRRRPDSLVSTRYLGRTSRIPRRLDFTDHSRRATLAVTVSNCVSRVFPPLPLYRLPGSPKEKDLFRGRETDFFLSKALLLIFVNPRIYSFTTSWPWTSFRRPCGQHMRLSPGTFFTAMGRYGSIGTFMLDEHRAKRFIAVKQFSTFEYIIVSRIR